MKNATIEINEQFQKALQLLEYSKKNIFITGKAGTGKSTLLNHFRSITSKKVAVLAPTGVAAVNISGQTIHSFFKFKPSTTLSGIRKIKSQKKLQLYKQIEMIIIDEISMVRPDLLDCIDKFMCLNGNHPNKPFGGVQMVFFGDLYQLPPVFQKTEQELFSGHYKGKYFFDSKVFHSPDFNLEFMELEKIYRQTDYEFVELLNSIRNGTVNEKMLSFLNKRVKRGKELETSEGICLTTTNKKALEINNRKLEELPGKTYFFESYTEGSFKDEYMPADKFLQLKHKSQVMLLNNDPDGRWVNGTIAVVDKILEDENGERIIYVELANGDIEDVQPYSWEIFQYKVSKNNNLDTETIGKFTQFPLKLAWAVTIHKSQGKTFDKVVLDISGGVFAAGQMYVALSRCRSFEGITLVQPILKRHIMVDWKIRSFLTDWQYRIGEDNQPIEEKIKIIKSAIEENKKISVVYLKSTDEKSFRDILPKKLEPMEYSGVEFLGLIAYCYERDKDRTFRVDRIIEIK